MTNIPQKPKVSIVVAVTKNNVIGNGPELVVRISDDLKRFKRLTIGHPIILGRKTYESIGKALPGRANFIVTRNKEFKAPDATVCESIEEAIEKASAHEMASANEEKEIFIIGGGEIYTQGLPFTDMLYLTQVDTDVAGDVFFPDYSAFTKVISKEDRIDDKTGLSYSWIDLERQ